MADIRDFPAIFEEVVTAVRAKWDESEGVYPLCEYGTYLELTKVETLNDDTESPKYPLIWLVWEANESERTYEADLMAKVKPRIFIVTHTNSDYTSKERHVNNFRPILYPLWDLFLKELNNHSQLGKVMRENYRDYDHLLWGESLGYQKKENVLFDTLDALEVKFIDDIRILPEAC